MAHKIIDELNRNVHHEIHQIQRGEEADQQPWYQALLRDPFMLLPVSLFGLFVPLARWAHRHPVDPTDVKITRFMQGQKSPVIRYAVLTLTYMSGLSVVLAAALWKMRLRLEAVMTLFVALLSDPVKTLLQTIVDRPRPSPLLVSVKQHQKHKSFPSGHVTASVTFWGWIIVLVNSLIKEKPTWLKAMVSIPLLLIGATGPSRVWLGDHWTTDVLGGYLFGGGWLSACVRVYHLLKRYRVLGEK